MTKTNLNDLSITLDASFVESLNENFTAIEQALDNCVSRDGSVPNNLLADIDLNGYDLLNVNTLYAKDFRVNGADLTATIAESIAAAAASADEAAASAAGVEAFATAASNSADAASVSATSAATSATTASDAATTATTKAGEAATSATNAATSESNAATSETNAASSAAAAASSASTAATEATNASNSASAAATSASNAASSETNAASSASAASASASAASTSETNAAASETAAATSASNAATSETNAAASASAASTSETNAAASASAASTSASNAATSETNAASSASAAATSETNAATSESNASTSASNAATSEANAAATYDLFDDRMLGAKASDPTLDNDGNALVAGTLYYNTTNSEMRVYNGSTWDAAYLSAAGYLAAANNLSDLADAATARGNLGLGDLSTSDFLDYYNATAEWEAGTTYNYAFITPADLAAAIAALAPQQIKAWVNFNGTGTVAIRDALNVSSITDNGTGDYTINFTTAFADVNYACAYGGSRQGTAGDNAAPIIFESQQSARTTSAIRIRSAGNSGGSFVLGDFEVIEAAFIH